MRLWLESGVFNLTSLTPGPSPTKGEGSGVRGCIDSFLPAQVRNLCYVTRHHCLRRYLRAIVEIAADTFSGRLFVGWLSLLSSLISLIP